MLDRHRAFSLFWVASHIFIRSNAVIASTGFVKVRYRGIQWNTARLLALLALTNLRLVRRR